MGPIIPILSVGGGLRRHPHSGAATATTDFSWLIADMQAGHSANDDSTAWTLVAPSETDWEEVASDWDVRSIASESEHSFASRRSAASVASRRSAASGTGQFGDFSYDDGGTAPTALPLAAVPAGALPGMRRAGRSVDAGSVVSISTRRGWPRVAPQAAAPPATAAGRMSYRDMLLTQLARVEAEAASAAAALASSDPRPPARRAPSAHSAQGGTVHAEVVGGRMLLSSAARRHRPRGRLGGAGLGAIREGASDDD